MTLHPLQRQRNDFAPLLRVAVEPTPALTIAHDDETFPASVTTLTISHEWRRLLAAILDPMLERAFWVGSDVDIDTAIQNAYLLLEDLDFGRITGGAMGIAARVTRDTNFTLASATPTVIPLVDPTTTANTYDDSGFWNVANPTRLTVPAGETGRYVIYGSCELGSGATAKQIVGLLLNGVTVIAQHRLSLNGRTGRSLYSEIELVAGDYIELQAESQNSRDVLANSHSPVLGIRKLD